ncbi:MAG: hypothetical protein ACTHMG_05680 [Sphingomonas sp.]
MDINYLRARHDDTLNRARAAANEPARRAHVQLASLYEAQIAQAEREIPPAAKSRR